MLFVIIPIWGILIFYYLGLYNAVLRYMSVKLLKAIAIGVSVLILSIYTLGYLFSFHDLPRSVPLIFGLCAWVYLSGSRLFIRGYYHWLNNRISQHQKVIIYGAGAAGLQLVLSMQASGEYTPVAFIDNDINKIGVDLSGIPTRPPSELGSLIARHKVKALLLAIGNISPEQRSKILQYISKFSIKVLSFPQQMKLLMRVCYQN